jgi:hypothetical protein
MNNLCPTCGQPANTLNTAQVATLLDCAPKTVRKWALAEGIGWLHTTAGTGQRRYSQADVEKLRALVRPGPGRPREDLQ